MAGPWVIFKVSIMYIWTPTNLECLSDALSDELRLVTLKYMADHLRLLLHLPLL